MTAGGPLEGRGSGVFFPARRSRDRRDPKDIVRDRLRPVTGNKRSYQRFAQAGTDVRSRREMASLEQAARQMPHP